MFISSSHSTRHPGVPLKINSCVVGISLIIAGMALCHGGQEKRRQGTLGAGPHELHQSSSSLKATDVVIIGWLLSASS